MHVLILSADPRAAATRTFLWLIILLLTLPNVIALPTLAEEPNRPDANQFPLDDQAKSYEGQLVFVDHVNRRGLIRFKGGELFHSTAPQPFALLPYGVWQNAVQQECRPQRPRTSSDRFQSVLAGAGVKRGIVHGATDEIGMYAVDKPVHVRDFHATILHLMGLDHEKLTYRHAGLDCRLTGVEHAHVVKEILA